VKTVTLDSDLIRRLLPACRRSMLGGLPDLPAYDGRCLAEALARETRGSTELLLTELESWVMSHGGAVEHRERPRSRGLGRGWLLGRDPGPEIVILRLPKSI
jgi:hypothetical protein